MSAAPTSETKQKPETANCLTRSVVDVLSKEPALEAVTFNRTRHVISVATLGPADVPRLTQQLTERLQQAQATGTDTTRCRLLEGESDCSTCDMPLSPAEWQKVTVRSDGDATTIARVTCPTAPKFWRWREIPFPKVVQRDVEFLEHAEEVDEWKPQLAAALLCAVFGLTGYFLREQPYGIVAYLAAYLT
ncbi:MAG TPA: cation-transporting P-type ATPase, partial [Verrucomicrobiae bacterium]|nr:cation-transporting P-type ATPase [Verrucomicrobiae bacterium]